MTEQTPNADADLLAKAKAIIIRDMDHRDAKTAAIRKAIEEDTLKGLYKRIQRLERGARWSAATTTTRRLELLMMESCCG